MITDNDIKNFRKTLKQVKRENSFSEETRNKISEFICNDGWLYCALYFKKPFAQRPEGIIDFSELPEDFAAIEGFDPIRGKCISLFTSENMAENLSNVIRAQEFPFVYVFRVSVQSAMTKAKSIGAGGIIINPNAENIVLGL